MRKLLLAAWAVLCCTSVFAQNSKPILLTNHTITPSENSVAALGYQAGEVVDGRIFRLIQSADFNLKSKYPGVEFLFYLPKNTFAVSIQTSAIASFRQVLLEKKALVLKMQPEWKLSKKLFESNIPDWAWLEEGNFKLWVEYYPNLDHSQVAASLTNKGYRIIDERKEAHLIALAADPEHISEIAALPYLVHLQEMEDPGHPENYTARTDHRVNYLQAEYAGAPGYDGSGVVVGHGDDGALGDHLDYRGRLTQNSNASSGDHGDHVAGTIFGAGNIDPDGRGMAPGAEIYYQRYPSNLNDADFNYTAHNVRITSSSYSNGCNAGYTNFTQQMDQDAIDNPEMIHIFSAGNDGNSNCGYGAGAGWGNITGGHKIAKNVIAVANLSLTDGLAGSSSRGPASDGRIKPDVGAVGTQVYSTTDIPTPNSYTRKTGTSMACPGVSGTMATLYQAYKDNNGGQNPRGPLMKAIMMNTAEDLGTPGPDFRFGYGRINARRAMNVIKDVNYLSDTISSTSTGLSYSIPMPAGSVKEVRVMLYWPDAPASTGAARALVNDLDLVVTQNSTSYQPWVLDPTPLPTALSSGAVRARDSLNNVEQVTIDNPGTGNLQVDVNAFALPSASQEFYITYEFVMDSLVLTYPAGGEGFEPGSTELIRWDAPTAAGNFSLEYSSDSGQSWNMITSNIPPNRNWYYWTVPSQVSSQALLRVSRGSLQSVSPGTFSIIGRPANISFPERCPDSLVVSWDPVSSASGYVVYKMGNMYMDSIAFTTGTSVQLAQQSPVTEDWYSVAAVIGSKTGKRAVAVERPQGVANCTLDYDLQVSKLLSPVTGGINSCFATGKQPVKVELKNSGINNIQIFGVSFTFNGITYTDSLNQVLNPGTSLVHTFSDSLSLSIGNNSISVVTSFGQDENPYNDTLNSVITITQGGLENLPYFHAFESFGLCNTSSNCGFTNCNLNDGWTNLDNGVADDIDFRTNSGSTPSANTGPGMDFNPGTSNGRYLYLEASGGCDSAQAVLLSPCIFINTAIVSNPVMEFRYHMSGSNMGVLEVDLISEDSLVENVVHLSGSQGNAWQKASVNLSNYGGKLVMLRFRGKTGNGFESDISLDDFKIYDPAVTSPSADFAVSDTAVCVGDTITFSDLSSGSVSTYAWDFGAGAVPGSATTPGPHDVYYTWAGTKTVSYTVTNAGGSSTRTFSVDMLDSPSGFYTYGISQNRVSFFDASSDQPNRWSWKFGDGDSSNLQNPQHTYTSIGTYGVELEVFNDCGSDVYLDSVTIFAIDLYEHLLAGVELYPNPNKGEFKVNMGSHQGDVHIRISDLGGRSLRQLDFPSGLEQELNIDITDLPAGVYLVSVSTDNGSRQFRVVRE